MTLGSQPSAHSRVSKRKEKTGNMIKTTVGTVVYSMLSATVLHKTKLAVSAAERTTREMCVKPKLNHQETFRRC